MFWPTDTLYTSNPHHPHRAAHTSFLLRTRLNRRLTILLLLTLLTLILLLTRVLGQIARNTDTVGDSGTTDNNISTGGDHETTNKRMDDAAERHSKAERGEWARWEARREAEQQRAREAKNAEDIKLWLTGRSRKPVVVVDDSEVVEDSANAEKGIKAKLNSNDRSVVAGSGVEAKSDTRDSSGDIAHPGINHPIRPDNPSDSPSDVNPINKAHKPRSPTLGRHTYHPTGLLQVNPTGPHPIYELIERAEKEWIQKHQRASKTLIEAVQEYKRRYGRLPPTGFDIWWEYVQKHHIMLPDEYDQINDDLARFWAVNPKDLQATRKKQESHSDSFTIGKSTWSAPVSVLNFSFNGKKGRMSDYPELLQSEPANPKKSDIWGNIWGPDNVLEDSSSTSESGSKPEYLREESDFPDSFLQASSQGNSYGQFLAGAFNMFDILDGVQDYIPPFRAVFSPHDNPSLLRDWKVQEQALDAVKTGKTLVLNSIENTYEPHLGWRIACPPSSPARRAPNPANWDAQDTIATLPLPHPILEAANKSFIHSHSASMDPCAHPDHFILHGQFISHRQGPEPVRHGAGLIPMFSWSPTSVHTDITVAVGEGSFYPTPLVGDADEDFDFGAGVEGDFEDLGMYVDIEALLNLPDNELEHALDLDTDPRLLWRGSNTGIYHAPKWGWERAQRARLVFWAGGGEGAVPGGSAPNAVFDRELEEELGEHIDLKTAAAFGAGLRGKLHLLTPPPNDYSRSTTSPDSWLSPPNITRRPIGPLMEVKKAHYAPSMLDIAFVTGNSNDGGVGPNNCEPETCEKLRTIFEWRKRMEMEAASQYRFVMDIDGHAWSSRFRRLLIGTSTHSASSETPTEAPSDDSVEENIVTARQKRWREHLRRRQPDEPSASLVFKATVYKEWWYDRGQPWVHYVPIQIGLEDLWDILVFFKGKLGEDIDDLVMELRRHRLEEESSKNVAGNKARSKKRDVLEKRLRDVLERHLLGRKIARRGRKWAQRYWRKEDMVAYMFRLFLEYARVMSLERDKMFFDPDNPKAGFRAPFPSGPRKWDIVEPPKPSEDNWEDMEGEDEMENIESFDNDSEYDWIEEDE